MSTEVWDGDNLKVFGFYISFLIRTAVPWEILMTGKKDKAKIGENSSAITLLPLNGD